ncbi:MAG: hypothetical protein HY728_07510 [Candidatus Rokubacteria bacterium]|nr:hypothetical protein [Candidatus Rokubacteria bacterium]MBI4594048.1 hypothetical protein [Candidatus Rokubacteria bacterium]
MKSVSLENMRHAARQAGFDWTDAELEALRPGLERALESLAALERLPLAEVEPTTLYRVI